MGLAVVTVAAGGLPVVESTAGGTPVTEAANGYGVPVTKVVGKPGMPVVFETIGVGGGALAPPLDAVTGVLGAWSVPRAMLTSFGAGTRYTKSSTAIISLTDQTGSGRHLTDQASTARRPTEVTAFPSNILCADFDGVNNALASAGPVSNFISASSGAMVISLIIDAVTLNNALSYSNHMIMGDIGSQYMGLFARNLSGVTFYAYNYDGTEDAPSRTGTVGTPYVLMWRHHGGNMYVSVNGGTEVTVASGNTSNLGSQLYVGGIIGLFCNMKVAEIFTTNDGSQTTALAAAIANMKAYIGI